MPRQCGIATFTTDLVDAINLEFPKVESFVLAMNDAGRRHAYPPRVRFELADGDLGSYRRAADFLNLSGADVLSLQHEYGIFGAKAGSHVLALLRELRMPIVTTLHTILARPDPLQRAVMDELVRLSERLVVMSDGGAALLREVHGVPVSQIDVIPHGIPALPSASASKAELGVEGRPVILTFGLLSPDKGIEHVIDALPAILARHPEALYIVLGATHPHVKERHGETYRLLLENRAQELGVASSIIFHNRFVSHGELVQFLSAADLYITPYLNEEQITSGTLAYAVGAGKAVLSTPYRYARELLADDRGVLVPWRDSRSIAAEVSALLSDPARMTAMQARAAEHGRTMTWPVVARGYLRSFEQAADARKSRLHTAFRAKTLAARPPELPELDLSHLRAMTDDTGLLQHASFDVPRYEDGYCLDDNARALLVTALAEDAAAETRMSLRPLSSRYLAFVSHALDASTGRFRNFLSYQRAWTEPVGSEDSHGRAVWALGTLVGRSTDAARQALGGKLFHQALPALASFTSPRAWSYALLGIDEYLRAYEGHSGVEVLRDQLAAKLMDLFERSSSDEWPWFEQSLTYCNARLSQALLVSGARMERPAMVSAALRSLSWLVSVQRSEDGYFAPIGSDGFYPRGGPKAAFDQQPVEACAMISACLDARRISGDPAWSEKARRQFYWFVGQNQLHRPLYDPSTGGCRDGLHSDRVNENQGAESTLSFAMALLELRLAERVVAPVSAARSLASKREQRESAGGVS